MSQESLTHINVEEAFDPALRSSQAEMDAYLDSRPYQDGNGAIHKPENGQFAKKTYFEDILESQIEESMPRAYEDMSMTELAKAIANADFEGDTTKSGVINDVLEDKMISYFEKNKMNSDTQEIIMNRVIGVTERELSKLEDEESAPKTNVSEQSNNDEDEEVKTPMERAVNVLNAIAQNRLNGDFSEEDEQEYFLEYLDLIKEGLELDDDISDDELMEHQGVKDSLENATNILQDIHDRQADDEEHEDEGVGDDEAEDEPTNKNVLNLSQEQKEALKELEKAVVDSRSEFVKNVAKDMSGSIRTIFVGHRKPGSSLLGKLVSKIPGVKEKLEASATKHNEKHEKKLRSSEQAYLEALNEHGSAVAALLIEAGYTKEQITEAANMGVCKEMILREKELVDVRTELAGGNKKRKFAEWWVKNSSNEDSRNIKGMIKRGAVLAGAGAATAAVATLFAPAIVASTAAGGASASIAKYTNKKRAATKITNEEGESLSLSQLQSNQNYNKLQEQLSDDALPTNEASVGITSERVTQEVLGNRRRVRTAFAIGKIVSIASLNNGIRLDRFTGDSNGTTVVGDETTSTTAEASETTSASETTANGAEPIPETPNWSESEWNNFARMQEWFAEAQVKYPDMSDQELAEGFNRYLEGVKNKSV